VKQQNQNADPFDDSRRKAARAEQHFVELVKEVEGYHQDQPLEKVEVPHPTMPGHQLHKIVLRKKLPDSIADITGDILNNLRSALDIAAHTVAGASGAQGPRNSAFPFARNLAQMAQALGRSKDLPETMQSLFVGLQPYLGGDDILWALNEMCNTDKHKMLVPVGAAAVRVGARVGGTGFFSMPDPHIWDRKKNEMDLITFGPGSTYECFFDFHAFVAINDIKAVDGMPVVDVLHKMGLRVLDVLNVIEAESRRLGYVS
jgi:hypothetical protein